LQVKVPALNVQQASLQSIDLGSVTIGPVTVGDLVLSNTDVNMAATKLVLQSVSVSMSIHFLLDWNIHIGMPDWIPDINIGDTYDLGYLNIPAFNIGDVTVPGVTNIHLHIPTVVAQNMSLRADPLSVHAGAAAADQIHVANAALPAGGFTIAGLTLNSVQGSAVSVPDATLDSASIGHLHGSPISIPTFSANTLSLPSAQIPTVTSTAPLDIPANLSEYLIGFDAGILRVMLHVIPSARMHVEQLDISDASASATVGQIVLHNVTLPYDVLNLTLSQIGINTVGIPAFNVS
jgi:hypothetical protein